MIRRLPSLTSCRPSGTTDQPTSICPVMTCVVVPGTPPVAVGLALEPVCRSSASRIRFDDEPGEENATVLPSGTSLRVLYGLSAFTHQNSSLAPVISAEITLTGAPFT